MTLFARSALSALIFPLALISSCTQDFNQFEPTASGSPAGGSTSGSGGAGQGSTVSSSSASSSGSGGNGGTGGVPVQEDCLDGIDNDGDDQPDCADPDCNAGYECVDPVPNGWEGYFRINQTPYPNNAPSSCPDGSKAETFFDGPNAAECTTCSCGNWGGATCSGPPLTYWDGSNSCGGGTSVDITPFLASGACVDAVAIDNQNPRSCALTGPATLSNEGSCPPSGGEMMASPLWKNQDDVCAQSQTGGAGCGGNEVCITKGTGDYDGPVCVRKMGNDSCPKGFKNLTEVAADGTDDRSCTACTCAVNGASCMGGAYTVYDDDGCTGSEVTIDSTNCVNVSNKLDSDTGSLKRTEAPQPVGGSCEPGGGEPSGTVTPQAIITFCCK